MFTHWWNWRISDFLSLILLGITVLSEYKDTKVNVFILEIGNVCLF